MIGDNKSENHWEDKWDDEYVHNLQRALKDAIQWILDETSDTLFEKFVKKEWVDLLPEPLKDELNELHE